MADDRLELVVPEEAKERGHFLKGELRSGDNKISEVLAQLSKITSFNKKAKIFFYPTLEQAKIFQILRPPFSFDGSIKLQEGINAHYHCAEIWPIYGSEISHYEMRCFTHCSGRLYDLQITTSSPTNSEEQPIRSAWFITNGCFLLKAIATPENDELRLLNELNIHRPIHKFQISTDAVAEFRRIKLPRNFKRKNVINNNCYSVQVDGIKDSETAKKDVECLLILASLASRERSDFWYWNIQDSSEIRNEYWRFGMSKWSKRPKGEEPLINCNVDDCSNFLSIGTKTYLNSSNSAHFDFAVYALLARDLALEPRIMNLCTGVQHALLFASPKSNKQGWQQIEPLFRKFKKRYSIDLSDLWPLFDGRSGVSLYQIRNALVHGGIITDNKNFKALSIAAENIKWTLERILLVALGWDIELSSVSSNKLKWYTGNNWKERQQELAFFSKRPEVQSRSRTP